MMSKKYLVANWKMNFFNFETFFYNLNTIDPLSGIEVVIAPSFVFLSQLSKIRSDVKISAQNCSEFDEGAYTGEVSLKSLSSINISYVILGHSERRYIFHESNDQIMKKVNLANQYNIKPIICVGESKEDYISNKTYQVLLMQLQDLPDNSNLIIAYEPVWSIGSGLLPKNDEINKVVEFIKNKVKAPVLYGGSVSVNNFSTLLEIESLDGFLVGGASINYESFNLILSEMLKHHSKGQI